MNENINNVRWPCRGLVLKRFVECLNVIKLCLNDQHVFTKNCLMTTEFLNKCSLQIFVNI